RREVRREPLRDLRPAFGVADGVDLEPVAAEPELPKETRGKVDDLDVGRGLLRPETLEAPLPELAIAKQLRPLPAKHRVRVEEPDGPRRAVKSVLEERARHSGGPLGTEREPPLTVERNVVHLVTDDVARFADPLHEDAAVLHDRRDDPRVAITHGARFYHRLQRIEGGRFFGEQVPHSARGLKTRHGSTHDRPIE